jgi:tetratricopeptide (TPR) repeat protein|tara:strand:- start:39 stop:677 length:639 start_codon:yes stop_codon:yes gene_type:complete
MMVNSFILTLSIGIFCSMGFSEDEVLWDFGVVIKPTVIKDANKENPLKFSSRENNSHVKINAVITDPFIPPIRNILSAEKSDQVANKPAEISIYQLKLAAEKSYLMKNYPNVIAMLHYRDLSLLSEKVRKDLIYLLADAYYQNGNYTKAQTQVISLLKQNESDKLYLLLAMIYESLGNNKNAKDNYQKLIAYYPDSDYFNSAKIKSRILVKH